MSKKIVLTLCFLLILSSLTTVAIANTNGENARDEVAIERNARAEIGPGINCDDCDGEEVRLQREVRENRRLEAGENGNKRQVQKQQRRQAFTAK
ncbi:hypothetical protein [Fuchsiella alkaliacetigena]|uniref:hypothetical protein n=1 Tax=Fuchsiella alkaliacetigena TaxID=957042 RepID=UPI00200A9443|nr:hypothetical protein [Fuchsiella alkaliacetigena]MCK8825393.1 hypothetical protein [Fuchsiella alkaliacetigena]